MIRRDLSRWERREIYPEIERGPGPRDRRDEWIRVVADEPPGQPIAGGPHRRVGDAIWRYEIFPPRVIRGVLRRAPVEIGDTVGILYRGFRVIDLFFAARVVDRFDRAEEGEGEWRTGFTYRTLVGHPELGEETFAVEKDLATGRVRVALRSWSRPGTALARAFAPLARRQQVRGSLAALDHLHAIARGA